MFKDERKQKLIDFLQHKKRATVKEMASYLYVSEPTIRRDLIELERERVLSRSHGGAYVRTGKRNEPAFSIRETENTEKKDALCKLATDFLTSGMTVFLDASSTVLRLTYQLSAFSNMVFVTCGMETARSLIANTSGEVHIPGGHVSRETGSMFDLQAHNNMKSWCADIAFVSPRALSVEGGASCPTMDHVMMKRAMIQNASHTILLCDSTKFGKTLFCKLADFREFEAILTDEYPEKELMEAIEAEGCEVLVAAPGYGASPS